MAVTHVQINSDSEGTHAQVNVVLPQGFGHYVEADAHVLPAGFRDDLLRWLGVKEEDYCGE